MIARTIMDVISDENIGDTLRNVDHPNLARLLDSQVRSESTPGQHEHLVDLVQAYFVLSTDNSGAIILACGDLAEALIASSEETPFPDLLLASVETETELLRLCPPGHKYRGQVCCCLAHALWDCFVQNGDSALIEEAVRLGRAARPYTLPFAVDGVFRIAMYALQQRPSRVA
jgi:hypothetical protein